MIRYRLRGDAIKQFLADQHLSISDGARRLGVSRSYFSQLLAGARHPSPKIRRLLLNRPPFSKLGDCGLWDRLEVDSGQGPQAPDA